MSAGRYSPATRLPCAEVGPGISAGDGLDLGTLQQDGRLRISVGGRERLLTRVEKVEMCAPYEMLEASPLMPGACMQQWCTGVKYVSEKGAVGFECGTNRHSNVFYITPDMVYCRAARLRFVTAGSLRPEHSAHVQCGGAYGIYG